MGRQIVRTWEEMETSPDAAVAGLGEYLRSLIDGRGPFGNGMSKRFKPRDREIRRAVQTNLGDFRVRIEDLGAWWTSRAIDHAESDSD
jgi:hypothetical protein